MDNLSYLKMFKDVCFEKSVTKAAKKNFVTQSAVSQGIKKLEESLNCVLLSRHGQQIKPTPEGLRLLSAVNAILTEIENLRSTLKAGVRLEETISIGLTHSIAFSCIPFLVDAIKRDFPELKLQYQFSSPKDLLERVTKSQLDLCVVVSNDLRLFSGKTIVSTELGKTSFNIYKAKKSSWNLSEGVWITELERDEVRHVVDFFKTRRQNIEIAGQIPSWSNLSELVKKNRAVAALLPTYLAVGLEQALPELPNVSYGIEAFHQKQQTRGQTWLIDKLKEFFIKSELSA